MRAAGQPGDTLTEAHTEGLNAKVIEKAGERISLADAPNKFIWATKPAVNADARTAAVNVFLNDVN